MAFDSTAAAGWAGFGLMAVVQASTTIRQRFRDASSLERRVRHLEAARDRQGRALTILVKAHARAATAQRAGRSSDQIVADLLDAHAHAVQELAESGTYNPE